jgi:hypothetical protein
VALGMFVTFFATTEQFVAFKDLGKRNGYLVQHWLKSASVRGIVLDDCERLRR